MKFLNRNNPKFDEDQIRNIVKGLYDLEGDFTTLYSERDQNIHINLNDNPGYVLKIANADELEGVVDFQIKGLQHIEAIDPTLTIPRILETVDGETYTAVIHPNGAKHFVRVVSFLPGNVIDNVNSSIALRQDIGKMMAKVDIALRSFFHPNAHQEMLWDITQCAKLQPHTHHIKEANVRQIIEKSYAYFLENSLPQLKKMRHQVIHADAHGGNLLQDPKDNSKVAGLLDFGDMIHAPLIIEPVLAADIRGLPTHRLLSHMCTTISAYDQILPLEEEEINLIYDCLMMRMGVTCTITAWRQAETADQPGFLLDLEPKIWQTIKDMAEIGRDNVQNAMRKACGFPKQFSNIGNSETLNKRRKSALGEHLAHFYTNPVHLERGRGVWLEGPNGKKYLDGYNNVPVVGHCHPHVVRAISRQIGTLNTHTRYLYSALVDYAERLVDTFPDDYLNVVTLVNSGSEANDIAYRMAQHLTGNKGAIVMEGAYHGITNAIRWLSPSRQNPTLPPHVKTLRCPDLYRESLTVDEYAADADRAIAELAKDGFRPALFMLDSLFASNGTPSIPAGYVAAVVDKVRAAGGVFIADEVQSGFARSGEAMWGYELHNVSPDFVTMGKPIGSGYPLGAIATSAENLNRFVSNTGLFSTFGGNPVACAAGLAVLDVIEKEQLLKNSKACGEYLRMGIRLLMEQFPIIGDVRGHGLMAGVELVKNSKTKEPAIAEAGQLINLMREAGVLISTGGMFGNTLKIRPPLVFQKEHADIMVSTLAKSLENLQKGG